MTGKHISTSSATLTGTDLKPGVMIGCLKIIKKQPKTKTIRKARWKVNCTAPGCKSKPFIVMQQYLLRQPNPKTHCGCQNRSLRTEFNQEYRIWVMMRKRTSDESHHAFHHYGGRGIRVCPEWFEWETGFEAFLKYIGPRPSKLFSVDRIDVDGDYAPGNVRWATAKEQAANKRK